MLFSSFDSSFVILWQFVLWRLVLTTYFETIHPMMTRSVTICNDASCEFSFQTILVMNHFVTIRSVMLCDDWTSKGSSCNDSFHDNSSYENLSNDDFYESTIDDLSCYNSSSWIHLLTTYCSLYDDSSSKVSFYDNVLWRLILNFLITCPVTTRPTVRPRSNDRLLMTFSVTICDDSSVTTWYVTIRHSIHHLAYYDSLSYDDLFCDTSYDDSSCNDSSHNNLFRQLWRLAL